MPSSHAPSDPATQVQADGAFRRVAIVNRGESAMRCIHAIRELRQQHGHDLTAIAVHTDAERSAMFVREADEAARIGPPATAVIGGSPYLDYAELERVLLETRADAAWAGWGFVAEDPAFAELCDRLDITFIGPSATTMRLLGNKVTAKSLAEEAGVPVAAWSQGPVETAADAEDIAGSIGFPLLIKAAAGGGGRGIRVVRSLAEVADSFDRAREEARRAFGDPTVFMEQLVTGGRHVEVQIVADEHGGVWTLGVRDCSAQRRNQKVLEESHSPVLDGEREQRLQTWAAALVRKAGYTNAGTVEFLYSPDQDEFAFLEVNTRLQVEHPVTEATTGADLVKLQFHVASGGRLDGAPPPAHGYAIEARLNAEDPGRGFAPAPGRIEQLRLPSGPGIRVDTGVAEGDVIPPEFDSMIAKIISWGGTREEALGRLSRALAQTTVVVRGGTTNRAFLLDLVNHPEMVDGAVDTAWLDRKTADTGWSHRGRADVALISAAIDSFTEAEEIDRTRFYATASRGRPETSGTLGHTIDLRYAGNAYQFRVRRIGARRYHVSTEAESIVVTATRLGRFERRLTVAGNQHRIVSILNGAERTVEVDGIPHRISQEDAGLVRSPGPGILVNVPVTEGDLANAGSVVAVIESMKMETALTAPFTGHVIEKHASAGTQLDAGSPILRLEPVADDDDEGRSDLVPLSSLAEPEGRSASPAAALDALRRFVLGFDVEEEEARELVHRLERLLKSDSPGTPVSGSWRTELEILQIFADLTSLSRNRRLGDAVDRGERHAAREYFHRYLRSLDVDAEDLPNSFRDKLTRALGHYGVHDLARSEELEDALYRIQVAHARAHTHVPSVLALLERQTNAGAFSDDNQSAAVLRVLDQLILATHIRYPLVGDLARRVRYRIFDQPRLQRERQRVYDKIRRHIVHLSTNPVASDHQERMTAIVAAPEPLLPLLGDPVVTTHGLDIMLEVLTRRYYRTRDLDTIHATTIHGRRAVYADFTDPRGRGRMLAVTASHEDVSPALKAIGELAKDAPEGAEAGAVADVYVSWSTPPDDIEEIATILGEHIAAADLELPLRRVTFSVASTGENDPRVEHVTFRRERNGLQERAYLRGIHPLVAGRLDMWRFEPFDATRLPSDPEVYLFHCTARENPADERLFAFAEVRHLDPVRDEEGCVTSLPEFERVLASCLADLRQARAGFQGTSPPDWNRVVLYVWPPVQVTLEEVEPVIRALAPMTEGLGLEQVEVQTQLADPGGESRRVVVRMYRPPGQGFTLRVTDPPSEPLEPLDELTQKVIKARRRGTVYPSEIMPMLTRPPQTPEPVAAGEFTEHDLDDHGVLTPVDRPFGQNSASVILGVVSTPTDRYPEGMKRVAILGDPTKGLGSLAEPECRRIIAALDLAESEELPVEWFTVSSGARIAMDSGTENMDWIARALRRIVEFTQAGGEINIVVSGINVGAQPYWNAEATMLMHTTGILVMTPESAMVLTGKQALDVSGGVSADDNFGIGGYDRIMGPNGQAQYWAPDLASACEILFSHYDHGYVAPGERFPRRATTQDPIDRDVREFPHHHDVSDFTTLGEVFSVESNPGRKKPFDIRTVMKAVADQDHQVLERWADLAGADTSVVFDAHLGGWPVTLLGFESRPIPRRGLLPADGPDVWTAGTLFPQSSKKAARAINAASRTRPVVILANLSGFDGSPESLRKLQLEYGAEIGRAVVNFDGPIVFCLISRYHGGAFVVFSHALNDHMEVAALEGSHASVIGGAPAATVVFAREVDRRTDADPRVKNANARADAADPTDEARLRTEALEIRAKVRLEKVGDVAAEFDQIHSIERAQEVGSVQTIISTQTLRPYLIGAVQRGIQQVVRGRPSSSSHECVEPDTNTKKI